MTLGELSAVIDLNEDGEALLPLTANRPVGARSYSRWGFLEP